MGKYKLEIIKYATMEIEAETDIDAYIKANQQGFEELKWEKAFIHNIEEVEK